MILLRLLMLCAASCIASVAAAQDYPALFDVFNVAADDTLNVRSAPDATSRVIATLPYNKTDVEVVAQDTTGRWGQINTGETAGWVSLRYLQTANDQPWWTLVQPLYCFGTEPFWGVKLSPGTTTTFNYFTDSIGPLTPVWQSGAWGTPRRVILRHSIPNGGEITSYIEAEPCNDGMSDRAYGLSVKLFISEADARIGQNQMRGCCALSHHIN